MFKRVIGLSELPDSLDGQRRALLIGVNDYILDDHIGNLQYCVNDTIELNDILSNEQRGNFSAELLHSENENIKNQPTRSNIMSLTHLLATNSRANDTILFYFAGHGFEKNGINYLLPSDSRLNILSDSAIPLKWLKDTLGLSPARKKFMVIDACHSGSLLGRSCSYPMSESFYEKMFAESEGFAILSSCKIGQLSYDYPEKNHGVFSYYLLEGLKGAADSDGDGIITVPDSNNYVSKKLHEWSIDKQVQQNPTFDYRVSGDFIFVKIPPQDKEKNQSKKVQDKEYSKSRYEAISEIIKDISFMSYSELDNSYSIEELDFHLNYPDEEVKNAKMFLTTLSQTRFSLWYAKSQLMPLTRKVTKISEVKKWLVSQVGIKQFLISEFLTSGTFEYAGTMASIIQNLLPSFTDSELKQIIDGIDKNGQIMSSFKARTYILSIIDASKTLISSNRYQELKKQLNF